MEEFELSVEIIKVYTINIEAENYEKAVSKALEMGSIKIADQGSLKSTWVEVDQ